MSMGRCLHCQAELPDAGRFCVMCGRRVGDSLRERSSGRRVYTSAVGHSVPPEVRREIERSGDLAVPDAEEQRHLTGRTSAQQRRREKSALRELWQSLMWAGLLSTLAALVA